MSVAGHSPSRMLRLLVNATVWFARRPWTVIACCLLTIAASIYLSATRLAYHTQRDDLMSADKECQVRWARFVREFGNDDDMVFLVEGADRARMKEALDRLAGRLRQEPGHFDRVFYQVDLRLLHNRELLFLDLGELRQIEKHLAGFGPLLGPAAPVAWHGMTLQTITARAVSISERQRAGEKLAAEERDLLDQYTSLAHEAAKVLDEPQSYANPWKPVTGRHGDGASPLEEVQWFFSADGTLAYLLARPTKADQQSFTPVAESIRRARELIAETAPEFPDLQFGLTGLPVLEHDEMAGTDADSMRAAWLALAGMALLYLFVYRGFRYPLLTVSCLLAGTVWALAWTALTVGHLNILSSAFAVMLIGMGDYGVLWVARFDEECRAGGDFEAALRRTAAHAGPSILTAAVTTSLAFFAIMLADFQAVAELGFIAGSGVLLCALACFVLMPALLAVTRRAPKEGVVAFIPRPQAWLPRTMGRPKLVLAAGLVLTVLGGIGTARFRYDQNLLRLQSQSLDSVKWERKLLERLEGRGWHAISVADSPEEAIRLRKQYEALPEVSRVDEIASLVANRQGEKLELMRTMWRGLRWLPDRDAAGHHIRPDAASLDDELKTLSSAPDAEVAAAAAQLREAIRVCPVGTRESRLAEFDRRFTTDLRDSLDRLRRSATPEPVCLDDLPSGLRERFVSPGGKWLIRAYARQDLWEPEALAHFVEKAREVDPEATGKPFGTLEGLRSMTEGYFHAALYALLAIVIVLGIDFGDVGSVLLALLPLGVGVLTTLGIMRLFGGVLNPANLVALPLIVGVGVDNGVHVLHDFRGRTPGAPYRMSMPTARGILVAALTTIIGFGSLMISRHEGMFGLGLLLTLGVTCCMAAALVLLPAVLVLVDRRVERLAEPENARRAA